MRDKDKITGTVIPAQPGFDLVELCHSLQKLIYTPIVAWIITTSEDSDWDPCAIPVCIEWNSNSHNCRKRTIRQPNGDIVSVGSGPSFKKGEEAKALAYMAKRALEVTT